MRPEVHRRGFSTSMAAVCSTITEAGGVPTADDGGGVTTPSGSTVAGAAMGTGGAAVGDGSTGKAGKAAGAATGSRHVFSIADNFSDSSSDT